MAIDFDLTLLGLVVGSASAADEFKPNKGVVLLRTLLSLNNL